MVTMITGCAHKAFLVHAHKDLDILMQAMTIQTHTIPTPPECGIIAAHILHEARGQSVPSPTLPHPSMNIINFPSHYEEHTSSNLCMHAILKAAQDW